MDIIQEFNAGKKSIIVGKLTQNVINLLQIQHAPSDIVIWSDRYQHISKHEGNFKSLQSFQKCFNSIPEIIFDPDYVAKHPSLDSIEYIKQIDELVLVAVRIKKGKLAVKTMFPLTNSKLNDYINSGTAVAMK